MGFRRRGERGGTRELEMAEVRLRRNVSLVAGRLRRPLVGAKYLAHGSRMPAVMSDGRESGQELAVHGASSSYTVYI